MKGNHLYGKFSDWGTNVYFVGDTHFGDAQAYGFRIKRLINDGKKDHPLVKIVESNGGDIEKSLGELDSYLIKSINSRCGKDSTLVILGDVGDVSCVKRLRPRNKVLVLGNHDKGASNYLRVIDDACEGVNFDCSDLFYHNGNIDYDVMVSKIDEVRDYAKKWFDEKGFSLDYRLVKDERGEILVHYATGSSWEFYIEFDNNLFDEVYEGPLMIGDRLMISHEPVIGKFWHNIHGHTHNYKKAMRKHESCVCIEHLDFKPISLNELINEKHILKDVVDIHRQTIDKRTTK